MAEDKGPNTTSKKPSAARPMVRRRPQAKKSAVGHARATQTATLSISDQLAALRHEVALLRGELAGLPSVIHPPKTPLSARFAQRAKRTSKRWSRAVLRRTMTLTASDNRVGNTQMKAGSKAPQRFYCGQENPGFSLRPPRKHFLYGWIRLRLEVQIQAPHGTVALPQASLLTDVGCNFEQATRQMLHCNVQGESRHEHVIYLPPNLVNLRLELLGVPARSTVTIDHLAIQEITRQEAMVTGVLRHIVQTKMPPKKILGAGVRLAKKLRRDGLRATIERLEQGAGLRGNAYLAWISMHDTLYPADFQAIKRHIAAFERRPTFSIIMPVYNPPANALREAIASVTQQLYPHWQLCIADDASTLPHVREILAEAEAADPRITVTRRAVNGHICRASNDAIASAQGEFLVLFDHDDVLSAHALYTVAHTLNTTPNAQILYSDEDKLDASGVRYNPYFKSNFDPDLLRAQNFVSHLGVYKADLIRRIGGFRPGFEGSQDHDLILRASEQVPHNAIVHIPHVLYHWRAIDGSTAQNSNEKPYALIAAKKAIEEHLTRSKLAAKVSVVPENAHFRIQYTLPQALPKVSVIIPTRDGVDLLRQCISSLLAVTDYDALEIIVLDNDSTCKRTLAYLKKMALKPNVQVIAAPGVFNFSAINNLGASHASGDVLCLLNNDIEITDSGWLKEMVSHALRPEVGAVGARLFYPDGCTLQHAGVIMGLGGVADHAFGRLHKHQTDHFGTDKLVRQYSAVTAACLVIRKSVFDEVGGLSSTYAVAYNDVDLCLRLGKQGLAVVWTPFATLLHHESATRGSDTTPQQAARFLKEQAMMYEQWGPVIANDPFYNCNLTLQAHDFSLSSAPRFKKPWQAFLKATDAKAVASAKR